MILMWKCDIWYQNYKLISQPPKSRLADSQQKSHTKIVFFSEKKVVSHTTFGTQSTSQKSLTYDDSLTLLGSITTQERYKTL